MLSISTDPEKGHPSASCVAAETAPGPDPTDQPDRPLSNPGLVRRFAALGWGQVQGTPGLQHRPLHRPLLHSDANEQSSPGAFIPPPVPPRPAPPPVPPRPAPPPVPPVP